LVKAANDGQAFDTEIGRPLSEVRARNAVTWYQHVRAYMERKWPRLAAKSRRGTVEALTDVTMRLTRQSRRRIRGRVPARKDRIRVGAHHPRGDCPRSGTAWTDDGQAHERRGLKHRARTDTRPVPIPPRLVALLQKHVTEHDTAPDGRLFRGLHGGPLSESVYDRWWKLARVQAFTSGQVASPLARRPYDLRHAAASLWLNAGVPATEVARRLGHSVAVLLRVYANCIDGGEDGVNNRIGDALG
jgi:integrase